MTEAKLQNAISIAKSYILAGDPVTAACEDAAEEVGDINPKLVRNRLLGQLGVTDEGNVLDILRASHERAVQATEVNQTERLERAIEAARRWAREFLLTPQAEAMVGKLFTVKGTRYAFVGCTTDRVWNLYAINVATGERRRVHASYYSTVMSQVKSAA